MAIVEDVQARLDGYRTNKHRARRLRELRRLADQRGGYVLLEHAIEAAVLMLRLSVGKTVTAKEMSDNMQAGAMSGEFRMHVEIDGEHIPVPSEAFKKPH